MPKNMFSVKGNLCHDRVRLTRALQNPPITQEELARRLQFMGMEDMTALIISRIEKNLRHVCDAELYMLSQALSVSVDWLIESGENYSLPEP